MFGDSSAHQGYGSIDDAAGGGFNPRASGERFGELQNKLSRAIFDIGRQTNTLRDFHRQINRGQGDTDVLALQMERKLAEVQNMCKDAGQNMFNLALSAKNSGEREKQLIANTLRADFERAFSNFSNVQSDVINLLKNLPPQRPPDDDMPPSYGDSGSEVFFEEDRESARLLRRQREETHRREMEQRHQQQILLEGDTTMIQQRYEDMRQLEADVVTLNELMREIMTLVIEQGEQIDTIEQHVEYTQQKTVAGRVQLGKAQALQQSNRRLCCCIVCILVIILVVLGVISGIIAGVVKK